MPVPRGSLFGVPDENFPKSDNKKHIRWDDENLRRNEMTKTARDIIDEPDTPWASPPPELFDSEEEEEDDDDEDADEDEEQEEEQEVEVELETQEEPFNLTRTVHQLKRFFSNDVQSTAGFKPALEQMEVEAYGQVKAGDVPSRVRALSLDLGEPL